MGRTAVQRLGLGYGNGNQQAEDARRYSSAILKPVMSNGYYRLCLRAEIDNLIPETEPKNADYTKRNVDKIFIILVNDKQDAYKCLLNGRSSAIKIEKK